MAEVGIIKNRILEPTDLTNITTTITGKKFKPPLFSLTDFVSQAKEFEFAKTNYFEVEISTPQTLLASNYFKETVKKSIILYCEGASFPSINIPTRSMRIQGPAYIRPMGIDFSGESGIPLTFLVDGTMDLKAYFDAWMYSIVNPYSGELSYQDQYATTIRIKQLSDTVLAAGDRPGELKDQSSVVYENLIQYAFPRSMSILDLNSSSQNMFHKLTINFSYRTIISRHPAFSDNLDYTPVFNRFNRIIQTDPYKSSKVNDITFPNGLGPEYQIPGTDSNSPFQHGA